MSTALQSLLRRYPELASCEAEIAQAFETMKITYNKGGKILLAGNGGSAADCDHVVGELMKGFMSKRPLPSEERDRLERTNGEEEGAYLAERLQGALPAISLTVHSSLITAYANDVSAEMIFAQQVYGYGRPEDTLVVFSTSGNSLNIVRAVQVAKSLGLTVIGLTGKRGGRLSELCNSVIRVPYDSTPEVQERHLPIYHTLCIMLEEAFFAAG